MIAVEVVVHIRHCAVFELDIYRKARHGVWYAVDALSIYVAYERGVEQVECALWVDAGNGNTVKVSVDGELKDAKFELVSMDADITIVCE